MSTAHSFPLAVTRTHSFDTKELAELRTQYALPMYHPQATAKATRPFDLDALLKTYMKGMPGEASRWYTYTEWNTNAWTPNEAFDGMGYEEAHFWFAAYTFPDRFLEHRGMTHTSEQVLRERDYSTKMTGKQFAGHLATQNKALTKLIGSNSYMNLGSFAHTLCRLLTIMLPREEHLPTALQIHLTGIVEGYNISSLYSLFPTPVDADDVSTLSHQARPLIGELDQSASYEANTVHILITRYDITDEFSRAATLAQEHKHQLTSELMKIYYKLPEEEQDTFRKKFRASFTGHHLKVEFALNSWKNLTTWFDIGIAQKGDKYWVTESVHIKAPEAVKFFATLAASGTHRIPSEHWLHTQGANAVVGLIPLLTHRGHARDTAVSTLRYFKQQGHEAHLKTLADSLTDDAGKSKLQSLVFDWEYAQKPHFDTKKTPEWLTQITSTKDTLPDWLADASLPPQFTKDGANQLTAEQVDSLALLLKAQGDSHTHSPEILLARKHLSRRELGELSWAVFDAWLKHGAQTKLKWAYLGIGHFGTAHEGQKVAPHLKLWPKQNKWRMAQEVLEIYRMIGSDGALMTLNGVAEKVRQKSVRSRAQSLLTQIATARGLTQTQLADRIIPDCDLDEKGRYTFDYGARQFTLAFDNDLKPVLRDEKRGKIVKSLPKPGKTDDAELAEEARAIFKIMKKQIKEVISIQQPRLESAIITGRTWTGEEVKELLIAHPLMTHFARRLLWATIDKKKAVKACFRVDEDNNTLNAEDEPFALDDNAQVIVVHPLHLNISELETWGTVFGDYEIIPPFPQLNRPIYDVEPGEEGTYELKRFAGLPIPGLSLKGFVEKGSLWTRGAAEDAGIVNVFYGRFEVQKVSCVVDMEMGFDVGGGDWSENGGLSAVTFYKGSGRTYSSYGANKSKDALKLEDVPKMVLSEVLYSLYKFTSKYE